MREIVLDTETTGLNFRGDDRIIEVGCVEVINHVATKNTLQFYCRTEKEISIDAQKISGISNEFLKDKKTFSEQHLLLLNFINCFISYVKEHDLLGKRLIFLLQELFREINTINSKSEILEINNISLDIKSELEKIKEQTYNIL